ncbi:MAG: hypothetical protein FJ214_01365 [Ignavibacteria bacterium]|nr:hypothetical protein [Ignavibacteria bacterium]
MKNKSSWLVLVLIFSIGFLNCSDRSTEPNEQVKIYPQIPNSQIITSPSHGEIIKPGTTYTIRWSYLSDFGKVQIKLYRKEELKAILATALESNGTFVWKVPIDIQNSVHYRIKITCLDVPTVSALSDYFYIVE